MPTHASSPMSTSGSLLHLHNQHMSESQNVRKQPSGRSLGSATRSDSGSEESRAATIIATPDQSPVSIRQARPGFLIPPTQLGTAFSSRSVDHASETFGHHADLVDLERPSEDRADFLWHLTEAMRKVCPDVLTDEHHVKSSLLKALSKSIRLGRSGSPRPRCSIIDEIDLSTAIGGMADSCDFEDTTMDVYLKDMYSRKKKVSDDNLPKGESQLSAAPRVASIGLKHQTRSAS